MTAKVGTPMSSPTKPNNPPKKVTAKITQKADNPVESPKILGPMTLPSTCCKIRTKIKKIKDLNGSSIMMIKMLGIAPMKGPKYGITLVTPTMKLTSTVYGIRKMEHPTKQRTPMIAESKILPEINPQKIRLLSWVRLSSAWVKRCGKKAKSSFLICA